MSVKRGNWESCLQYAIVSDIGMRRDNNQDAFAASLASDYSAWLDRNSVVLFMVADGMGAHAAGELASKLAVDGVPHLYQKYSHLSAPEALKKAIQETNAEVHRRGQANADFNNMGTTVSVLLLLPQGAMIGHIGDSRVYMLRQSKFQQLTFDHSLVWEMRRHSQLPKDANTTIPKNVITRSLGPYPDVEIDVEGPVPLEQNDVFLLCTDGLTGKVSDEELAGVLAHLEPQRAANLLTDLANLRGGPDNITVIVAKVVNERMATAVVAPAPIVMGAAPRKPATLPLAWIAGSVMILAALLALIIEQWLVAGGLVVAAAISTIASLATSRWRTDGGVSLQNQLGSGPYVSVNVPSAVQFARQLKAVVTQLRESGRTSRWEGNPSELNTACDEADEALRSNNPSVAIRTYSQVVHDLMGRLRAFHARGAADTTIDWKSE